MLAGENSRTVTAGVGKRLTEINLAFGALPVLAVLFFLLGNVHEAIIAAAVIPLSFPLATIAMNRFGISGKL